MNSDIPLGRLFGVKIGMSWSVLLIAALYVYILAEFEFPRQVFDMSTSAYWIAGVTGALIFFLCILLHELGHALMAKRAGIGVQGITLWLLGGVAVMDSQADTPGKEFGIAAAGPVMNALLAGLFFAAHAALDVSPELFQAPTGIRGLAAVLCAWLAYINLLLAAFNLLPAAPLDGGQLLSASLWAATGNHSTGRLWSARCGMVLGISMLLLGFNLLINSDANGGIWIAAIGWWIANAARTGIRQADVDRRFTDVTLGQIMRPNPPILPGSATLDQLTGGMLHNVHADLFAVQAPDGQITGVLTAQQIAYADPSVRASVPIAQLAFPLDRVSTSTTDALALDALRKIPDSAIPHILVLAPNGRVVGTVSNAEVARVLKPAKPSRKASAAR